MNQSIYNSINKILTISMLSLVLLSTTCSSRHCYIKFQNKTDKTIILDSLKIKNKNLVFVLNDTIPGNTLKDISIKEDKNLFIENRDSVFQLFHHYKNEDNLLVMDIALRHLQYGEGFKIKMK